MTAPPKHGDCFVTPRGGPAELLVPGHMFVPATRYPPRQQMYEGGSQISAEFQRYWFFSLCLHRKFHSRDRHCVLRRLPFLTTLGGVTLIVSPCHQHLGPMSSRTANDANSLTFSSGDRDRSAFACIFAPRCEIEQCG